MSADGVSTARVERNRFARPTPSQATVIRGLAVLLVGLGALFAVALIAELALPLREGAHHDFLAFFGAGKLVLDGDPAGIYDPARLTAVERAVVPGPVGANGYMPFINPPFAAAVFAPLAALSPEVARAVWAGISLALLVAAALVVARPSSRDRALGALLVALSFPVYHTLAEGQWSILLLAAGLAALAAGRRGRWALVGLALGLRPGRVLEYPAQDGAVALGSAELAAKAEMDMWARVVPMEAPPEMAAMAAMAAMEQVEMELAGMP